ncbi:trace amine-associated receptor 13c-like [Myripristis murdjan]|uniref:trace amine-associated receptor 13c-like n=1 Tax=Myripristis murdjan TaxID=586833 RepID=UPI00117629EE|nr:trace amine-associated receptor 13c-like [Myripristis murdjan]
METLEGAELCFPQLLNTSCRKSTRPRSQAMTIFILMSSISVLTVALNLLVIISISHFRKLQTPTNLLLLSLAVSDFLVGFLLMPGEVFRIVEACWLLGDLMCALYYYVGFVIISASVGNMVLISVDRYVAICDPLRYPSKITPTRVKIYVCLCWICSVFFNCLLLKDHLTQSGRQKTCFGQCLFVISYVEGAVDLVFNFICPISVIIALYVRVFVVAVSQARAMHSHVMTVQPGATSVTVKKSELKAARTLGIVIVIFLLCFCPYYFPSLTGQDILSTASSTASVVWLLYFNSCLNPVIYAFFYPWFRKSVKLIVTLQILQPDSCEANIL